MNLIQYRQMMRDLLLKHGDADLSPYAEYPIHNDHPGFALYYKLIAGMMKFLRLSLTRHQAARVAARKSELLMSDLIGCNVIPKNNFILMLHDDPYWVFFAPWNDGKDMMFLRSSRVIIVSRKNGDILYDGSAHDEG